MFHFDIIKKKSNQIAFNQSMFVNNLNVVKSMNTHEIHKKR